MNIIADIERDLPKLAHIVHHAQEAPVTTPETTEQPAAPKTAWQLVHRDAKFAWVSLENTMKALGRMIPLAERIVTDPVLDRFVETALRAADLGVDATLFEFLTNSLRAEIAKVAAVPAAPADGDTAQAPSGTPAEAPVAPDTSTGAIQDGSGTENASPSVSEPQATAPTAATPAVPTPVPAPEQKQAGA